MLLIFNFHTQIMDGGTAIVEQTLIRGCSELNDEIKKNELTIFEIEIQIHK